MTKIKNMARQERQFKNLLTVWLIIFAVSFLCLSSVSFRPSLGFPFDNAPLFVMTCVAQALLFLMSLYMINGIRQNILCMDGLNIFLFSTASLLLIFYFTGTHEPEFALILLGGSIAGYVMLILTNFFGSRTTQTKFGLVFPVWKENNQNEKIFTKSEQQLRAVLLTWALLFLLATAILLLAIFLPLFPLNDIDKPLLANALSLFIVLCIFSLYGRADPNKNFFCLDMVILSNLFLAIGMFLYLVVVKPGQGTKTALLILASISTAMYLIGIVMRIRNVHARFGPEYLFAFQARSIVQFSEAIFAGQNEAISPEEVAKNIDTHLGAIESSRKHSIKYLLLFMIELLPVVFLFSYYIFKLKLGGMVFSRMGALERRTYITHRFRKATILLFRDVAKLKQLFYLGYYGDARVQKKIGFEPAPERQRYKDKPPVGRNLPDIEMYFPDRHAIETEICVIGSGAGGAVVAHQLAQRGHEVMILEAGPYMRTKDIEHDETSMTRKLYKDGGLQALIDFDMTIFQGRCLGGSTLINNAICINLFESNPGLLDRWQAMGATIDSGELQDSFARVGKMLNITEIKPDIGGENARILFDGIAAIDPNKEAKYFEKNYRDCYGCGYCNWGCPYDRKLSMLETYLPQAVTEFGVKIIPNCQALAIQKVGWRARGVRCEYNGRELFVKAGKIVVSCGAVASSLLLLNSGFKKNVGKFVSFNAATPVIALFDREIRGFDGVQMASYVQMDGYLFETWFNPPMTQAVSLAGWFEEHFELMENYRKMGSIGIAMGTESNAEVVRPALVRNLLGPVKYKMSAVDLARMKEAIVNLANLYFASGALKVYPPVFNASPITRADFEDSRIAEIINARLKKPDDFYFNTAHPQGGNVINVSPEKGVIDNDFKVHGSDNIFVCDASVFPTTVGINPQWTIMAMADYAAARISGR